MPPKPKPEKRDKKKRKQSPSTRTLLEKELEALCREIVFWRDASQCVQRGYGGCGGPIQWGHFLPRGQSSWLKYDIGNTTCQCATHNLLHKNGSPLMQDWYISTFGADAFHALVHVMRSYQGQKHTIPELREQIEHYKYLLETRPAVFRWQTLVDLGYYGAIIQEFGK